MYVQYWNYEFKKYISLKTNKLLTEDLCSFVQQVQPSCLYLCVPWCISAWTCKHESFMQITNGSLWYWMNVVYVHCAWIGLNEYEFV